MQTTNKELYHFWQEFSKLIKKDTPAICKKFNKKTFVQVLKEDFFETPRMKNGYPDFVDMANAINSKEIDFNQWVLAMIGEFIAGKLKKKNCLNPNYMKNVVKFYTVKEINHQRDLINKLSEDADSDCPFTEFSDAKFDLYQVKYWFFLEAEDNNCFKIDESKIIDQSFNQFLRLMHIIRQNIKE